MREEPVAAVPTIHDAAVLGGGNAADRATCALQDAGMIDLVALPDDTTSSFDADTDTWVLRTPAGAEHVARIVIAAHGPFHLPVELNVPGRNDFDGAMFHAATWDGDFDPAGKRVAFVGAFAAPPIRLITVPRRTVADRIRRRSRNPRTESVTATVERITPTGIRTADGAEHTVDAIVFAPRYTLSDALTDETVRGRRGLPLREAWRESVQAYLGLAVHGFPNFFLLDGPGCPPDVDEQLRGIAECLVHMRDTGSSRVEVRLSSQHLFAERGRREPVDAAFDFGTPADDDLYDGPAVVVADDRRCDVRARLTGHLDPIDGRFHWRGTIFGAQPLMSGPVRLDIGDRSAPARITEQTPQGGLSIAGAGMPPFPLEVRPTLFDQPT